MTIRFGDVFAAGAMLISLGLATAAHAVVSISKAPTKNMNCVSGVCSPTAANAVLNTGDLTTLLAGSNVIVNTGTGSLAQQVDDIVIVRGFTWASARSLTLESYRSIIFEQPVTVAGTAQVTLAPQDGDSSGIVTFEGTGSLSFLGTTNALSMEGQSFTLENSISTLAAAIAANPTRNYALANSYNASKDGVYSKSPIATTFTGVFEGLGHSISHLTVKDPVADHSVGLFSEADSPGVVRDIAVSSASITGANTNVASERIGTLIGFGSAYVFQSSASGTITGGNGAYVGGLAGWNFHSTIDSSKFSGKVVGGTAAFVGGVAGINDGTVEYSTSSGEVTAGPGTEAGGLIGENAGYVHFSSSSAAVKMPGNGQYGTVAGGLIGYNEVAIDTSHATGAITVGDEAFGGGLIGLASSGTVATSYATGLVHGGKMCTLGGLSGGTFSDITTSFATGVVTGGAGSQVGGFLGMNSAVASNDYSLGEVTGGSGAMTGGFAGVAASTANTSYSIGKVKGSGQLGGFVGYLDGTYSDSYWDTTTSGIDQGSPGGNIPGITGLTDAQLLAALPGGFDSTVWGQSASINNGYPYLLANPPPGNRSRVAPPEHRSSHPEVQQIRAAK